MKAVDPLDFSPGLLRIQDQPPAPLAGWMLRLLIALLAGIVLWAAFGELDIVAVAEGKLVPSSYLQIVQPSEQGIVKEILVTEGEDGGTEIVYRFCYDHSYSYSPLLTSW